MFHQRMDYYQDAALPGVAYQMDYYQDAALPGVASPDAVLAQHRQRAQSVSQEQWVLLRQQPSVRWLAPLNLAQSLRGVR